MRAVCKPGYGGTDCQACTDNFYSAGGATAACSDCGFSQNPNVNRSGCGECLSISIVLPDILCVVTQLARSTTVHWLGGFVAAYSILVSLA
jgi:hypothetical protein